MMQEEDPYNPYTGKRRKEDSERTKKKRRAKYRLERLQCFPRSPIHSRNSSVHDLSFDGSLDDFEAGPTPSQAEEGPLPVGQVPLPPAVIYEDIDEPNESLFPVEDQDEDEDEGSGDEEDLKLANITEVENPMYPGASVSYVEFIVMIIAVGLRHNCTKECKTDILTLLSIAVPKLYMYVVPSSYYKLKTQVNVNLDKARKIYHCQNCHAKVVDSEARCSKCGEEYLIRDLESANSYFYTLNVEQVLRFVLNIPLNAQDILKNLLKRNSEPAEVLTDVMDGAAYKKIPFGTHDLSCQLNTDGVSPHESGIKQLWPVFISINEMSYKRRRKCTLLIGMWFGPSKPNFLTFFEPLVEEFNRLQRQGIHWSYNGQTFHSKVYFPICTADSMGRPLVQGFKQHNGYYGCPWCLCRGSRNEGDKKQIYPADCLREEPRTDASVRDSVPLLDEVAAGTRHVDDTFGVVRKSPLLLLDNFDIVYGCPLDYMHCVLLGVVRQITRILLYDTSLSDCYLNRDAKEVVEQRWARVKVCRGTNRRVRALAEEKSWKAHEWKTWMLMWIPILRGQIREHVLNLLSRFTLAILLLLQDEVTIAQVRHSEKLLYAFCRDFERTFGRRHCTFNVHILSHASKTVLDWGPLWAYSLYQYESANGRLTRYFKGSHKILTQIVQNAILHQEVITASDSLEWSPKLTVFVQKLLHNRKEFNKVCIVESGIYLGGAKKKYYFNAEELAALRQHNVPDTAKLGWSYPHLVVHKVVFDVPPANLQKSLSTNSLFQSNSGSIYNVKKFISVHKKAFVFANRLTANPMFMAEHNKCILKITNVGKRLSVLPVQSVNGEKFHVMLDKNEMSVLTKLPNLCEVE